MTLGTNIQRFLTLLLLGDMETAISKGYLLIFFQGFKPKQPCCFMFKNGSGSFFSEIFLWI